MSRPQRLESPPIAFAHRGASAHAPENTLEAFELAVRLGATGLESDCWLTADGEVVLDHDGQVGRWPRARPISKVARADLPGHIPTLAELYDAVGTDLALSLDVKDPAAAGPTVAVARAAGGDAVSRLWLCHPLVEVVEGWRDLDPDVRLVDSTRMSRISEGPERRALRLRDAGIDAVNLHWRDWTGGHVATFHRFGRRCFGWDAQHEAAMVRLLDAGIDGLYSDHVDRLIETVNIRA